MTQQFHFQTPKRKAYVSKKANVNSSFIYSSPNQEATYLSINRVRKQLQYVHTVEYHSAIKKNTLLVRATTWTDLKTMWVKETHDKNSIHCITPFI